MVQAIDDLDFFDEVTDVPVPEALFFEVFLYCYLLTQPSAEEDLPITSFANRLNDLNLVLGDEKGQLDASTFQIL